MSASYIPPQPRLRVLAILLFACGLLSLILPTTLSIIFSTAVLITTLIIINDHTNWSLSHPFAFVSVVLLMNIIGPLIDFLFLDSREATWALLGKSREILVLGTFVVITGVAALIYGYSSVRGMKIGKKIPKVSESWNRNRAMWTARIYAIVGVIGFTIVLVSISFTDISSKRQLATVYIRWLVQFLFFSGLIVFITLLHHNETLFSKAGFAGASAIGLFFMYGFIVSSRSTIFWNSILLFAIYVQYRRIRAVHLIGTGGVFAVLSSLMLALRGNATRITEYLLPLSALDSVFGADRGGITAVSHLVQMAPREVPLRYGRTMIDWIVFPIPRAFWEGKPVTVGNQLATIIYDANNGTPPGLIGDLYWNFWIFGVLIGMFTVGIVLRLLVSYRGRSSNSPAAVLFTTVSIYLIAKLPVVTPLMINLGLWLVPISIAILVVRASPQETSQEAVEELPVPLRSSLLVRTIFVFILLPHRLMSRLQKDNKKPILTVSNGAMSKVIDSSYFLNIIKRFDQSPDEQN